MDSGGLVFDDYKFYKEKKGRNDLKISKFPWRLWIFIKMPHAVPTEMGEDNPYHNSLS